MTQRTPLYDIHVQAGGKIVDFHGWDLPVQYEGVLAEHHHCRKAASIFDTSHIGQFHVFGPESDQQLSAITTQNAATLAIGRCKYGFLLNEKGGVIDDTILMRLDKSEYLLVVNSATMENDFAWLSSRIEEPVQLVNLSAKGWGKLDIQGPLAFDVLNPLVDRDLVDLSYFSVVRARFAGRDCVISRTGYTGELGYEVMAPGDELVSIFKRLTNEHSVRPAGLGARDSLRLEMGYPLYGQDLDENRTPLEGGMERFLSFDHDFIGAAALKNQKAVGGFDRLVAFRADTRRRASSGSIFLHDGQAVGVVTSGGFAPSLDTSIGMGYVRPDLAAPGQVLTIDLGKVTMDVKIADKPLYKEGTCAKKLNVSN